MKKEKLTKYQKQIRSKIYWDVWEKYKDQFPMGDLAIILKTSLSNFYQIIKRKENEIEKAKQTSDA